MREHGVAVLHKTVLEGGGGVPESTPRRGEAQAPAQPPR